MGRAKYTHARARNFEKTRREGSAKIRDYSQSTMARCKEAKFKVAKRHYLQISPANFLLCYVKFIDLQNM